MAAEERIKLKTEKTQAVEVGSGQAVRHCQPQTQVNPDGQSGYGVGHPLTRLLKISQQNSFLIYQ